MDNPWIYHTFIDPLLYSVRKRIKENIPQNASVIDIASGTGSLGFSLNSKVDRFHGMDLSKSMVSFSENKARKLQLGNIRFYHADASNLAEFPDKKYDFSIISLALHQFHPPDQLTVLHEALRISDKTIIVDYSCPLPVGYKNFLVHIVERIAGKVHYKNFQHYMKNGGLNEIPDQSNLKILKKEVTTSGIFSMLIAE